jgi:hypothetical protein
MTNKDFANLSLKDREYFMCEILPIINVVDKHVISFNEIYILLEYFVPLIADKALFGESLKRYLDNLGDFRTFKTRININNYK